MRNKYIFVIDLTKKRSCNIISGLGTVILEKSQKELTIFLTTAFSKYDQ